MVLNDFLYAIDPNTMILGLLFVIFFAIINFALYRMLKNKGTSSIISFCVSLLAVYGINRTNFDISGVFYNIGVTEGMIYTVVPILILVGLGFMIWKLKLSWTLMLIGAILIIASLIPGLLFEKGTVMIIGIVLLVLGFILLMWKKRKIKKKLPGREKGRDFLIRAAKQFRSWAKAQPKPKFVGNWTNFINYLKKGGYGESESEICDRLQLTKDDFVDIFNKYGLV